MRFWVSIARASQEVFSGVLRIFEGVHRLRREQVRRAVAIVVVAEKEKDRRTPKGQL